MFHGGRELDNFLRGKNIDNEIEKIMEFVEMEVKNGDMCDIVWPETNIVFCIG